MSATSQRLYSLLPKVLFTCTSWWKDFSEGTCSWCHCISWCRCTILKVLPKKYIFCMGQWFESGEWECEEKRILCSLLDCLFKVCLEELHVFYSSSERPATDGHILFQTGAACRNISSEIERRQVMTWVKIIPVKYRFFFRCDSIS